MCTCVEVIHQIDVKKSRKNHRCAASEFLREVSSAAIFSFAEKRLIVKARQANWKISKGQPYIHQVNKMEGEIYTFKAIPEIHQLCLTHDLYPECEF